MWPQRTASTAYCSRVTHDRVFKFADEIDRVLDPLLRVGAERPITEPEAAAHEVDQRIEREQELVAKVAGEGEPAHVLDHRIQLVSVNDENAPSIGGGVDDMLLDRDMAVDSRKSRPRNSSWLPGM